MKIESPAEIDFSKSGIVHRSSSIPFLRNKAVKPVVAEEGVVLYLINLTPFRVEYNKYLVLTRKRKFRGKKQ